MRRRHVLALPLVPAMALNSAFAQGIERAELPSYAVGDMWTFGHTDVNGSAIDGFGYRILNVGADHILVRTFDETGEETEETLTPELNRLHGGERLSDERVEFPLVLGAVWNSKFRDVGKKGQGRAYDLTRRVVAAEAVSTPAGRSDSLRIESSGVWSGDKGHNGRFEETYWYAPAAKNVVRYWVREWERRGGAGSRIAREAAWALLKLSIL